MPHPLVFDCHIKVQTVDRSTTPNHVFGAALEDLKQEIDRLQFKLKEGIDKYENADKSF